MHGCPVQHQLLFMKPVLIEKQKLFNQIHFHPPFQAWVMLKQLVWKNKTDSLHLYYLFTGIQKLCHGIIDCIGNNQTCATL